jgi:hypothetical protein
LLLLLLLLLLLARWALASALVAFFFFTAATAKPMTNTRTVAPPNIANAIFFEVHFESPPSSWSSAVAKVPAVLAFEEDFS